MTPSNTQTWAHAFGGINTDNVWSLVIFEDSAIAPDGETTAGIPIKKYTVPHGMGNGTLSYLASWDHPPTEAEKLSITPADYR